MSIVSARKDSPFIPHWVDLGKDLGDEKLLWLRHRREAALTALMVKGFPTVDHEEWKYAPLSKFYEHSFRSDPEGFSVLPHADTDEWGISLGVGSELVFVNGRFRSRLSCLKRLPQGVHIISLGEILPTDTKVLEKHFAHYLDVRLHPFAAFNTLRFFDGAMIVLEDGVTLREPIHLHYITDSPRNDIVSYPRNLIVAGQDSHAMILESYIGYHSQVYLTNAVTEVVLGKDSGIDHYKLQSESDKAFHMATMHVEQGEGSYCHARSISFGGEMARFDLDVRQEHQGADFFANGLYLAMNNQHVDHHLHIDHLKPHGTSHLLFKGVLDGKARAVFNGKVVVHKGASKTNANQTSKNLLLSPEAEADPKPELEIYHNDVKCSHGATVGQLDEEALFYLRSRGIALPEARQILTLGFAKEVLQSFRIERLEAYSECQLIQRLGGMKHE